MMDIYIIIGAALYLVAGLIMAGAGYASAEASGDSYGAMHVLLVLIFGPVLFILFVFVSYGYDTVKRHPYIKGGKK